MARRRQGSPCTNGNNTSDSEESKGSPKSKSNSCEFCGQCTSLLKAINTQKINKASFIGEILASKQCKQCKADEKTVNPEAKLYMCLQCGQCACFDQEKDHATQHYSAQRSNPHFIGLNLKEWKFHCFKCDKEIDPACNKKLPDLLNFVKTQSAKIEKSLISSTLLKDVNNVSVDDWSPSSQKKKVSGSAFSNSSKQRVNSFKMCRVRGLTNLGNTCFFNSVLQCLAQTPFLLDLLKEIQEPDEEFVLPEKDDEEAVKLVLGKWGPVTESLATTLTELTTPEYNSAFAPRKLFDALRQKCPQFQGYDQHDSHELLRHLLECVRLEDLKRYQRQIFAHNGTSIKVNPQELDKETTAVLKKMNKRIQDTVTLRPEHLFKGTLVSTLTCQSCSHVSDTEERFLDLSLPIAGEKPQPKKKRVGYSNAKCNSKRRVRTQHETRYFSQRSPENGQGDSRSPKKQDESDSAEVEDNEDSKKADGESGYSSEKPGSTRGSPIPTPNTPENMCSITDSGYSVENSVNLFENGSVSLSVRISPIPPESTAGCGSPDSICANASPGSPSGSEDPHTTGGVDADSVKSKLSSLDFYQNNYLSSNVSSGSSSEFFKNHKALDSISEFRENYDQPIMDNLDPFGPSENNENENDKTLTSNDANAEGLDGVYSEINILRNGSNDDYGVPPSTNSNVESPVSNPPESEEEDDDSIVGPSNFVSFSRFQYNDAELSVTSCLNQFTALELMSGSNKVSCENCVKVQIKGKTEKAVYSTASKRFLIRSPPAVLILHLKRFQVMYTSFQKIHRFVSFPLILDIDPYCSDKCREEWRAPGKKEILYSLYGVVVHSGSLGGGHYIAYVKARSPPTPDDERMKFVQGLKNLFKREEEGMNEENNKEEESEKKLNGTKENQDENESNSGTQWYYISDSHVAPVAESDVLKCEAYLLFYERIL